MAFVAKDAKGFQKSLGGDVFTAAWARAGDDEPATHGTAPFQKWAACLVGSAVPRGADNTYIVGPHPCAAHRKAVGIAESSIITIPVFAMCLCHQESFQGLS